MHSLILFHVAAARAALPLRRCAICGLSPWCPFLTRTGALWRVRSLSVAVVEVGSLAPTIAIDDVILSRSHLLSVPGRDRVQGRAVEDLLSLTHFPSGIGVGESDRALSLWLDQWGYPFVCESSVRCWCRLRRRLHQRFTVDLSVDSDCR